MGRETADRVGKRARATGGAAARPRSAVRARSPTARSPRARPPPAPRCRGCPYPSWARTGRVAAEPVGRPGAAWAGGCARAGEPRGAPAPLRASRAPAPAYRASARGSCAPPWASCGLRAPGMALEPTRAWARPAGRCRRPGHRSPALGSGKARRVGSAWATRACRCGGAVAYAAARRGRLRGVRRSTVDNHGARRFDGARRFAPPSGTRS